MAVKDWNGFRHTDNASVALSFGAEVNRTPAVTGNSGTLYASPYYGPGGLLSAVRVGLVTPAADMFARCALYTTDGTANLYPASLVSDIGCISCVNATSNTLATTITLDNDRLYWRVVWVSGLGAFALNGTGATGRIPVFGHEAGVGAAHGGITVPHTGNLLTGAFPATFPHSGRTITSANLPTFYLSYSGAV
jgi:hypothetical protein